MSSQEHGHGQERLYLFDTTLRDGAQTLGVGFSTEDKRLIAERLDTLGIDYIEGGYPGANPTDTALFENPPALEHAKLVAFGMTKRAGRSASNDPGFAALLGAGAPAVCLVAKSWAYQVELALGISNEENLQAIAESTEAIVANGQEALIDCEHFFDGYKANPDYALACAKAACDAGARWIVLCDTNGGTLPHEIEEIVATVARVIPGERGSASIPTTTPATASPTPGGRRRRRAAGSGHAQRAGRALRQRQPDLDHPHAGAEGAVSQPVHHRRDAGAAQDPEPCVALSR